MKCKKHPNYKAIRPPTADCYQCKRIYRAKMTESMKDRWKARKTRMKKNKTKIKIVGFRETKKRFQTEMGKEAFKEMLINAEILDKKHLDYGPGNIARFGLRGIVVRANDKIERLATLTDNNQIQKAQFESIEDTLRDLSNYATIGLLCMKGKWK
jgi:hypothetical protein